MDRLSILLTLMTGSVLTGGLVISAFSIGIYAWWVIISAAVAGFVLSWPTAYFISRRIKRQDSDWDDARAETAGYVPRPRAREV